MNKATAGLSCKFFLSAQVNAITDPESLLICDTEVFKCRICDPET